MISIRGFYFKYQKIIIPITVVLLVTAMAFALLTRVKVGSKTVCKYDGKVLKDNTKKIVVFRWNANKYGILINESVCEKHKKLEEMYSKAQDALAEGDTENARKFFETIKRIDPDFKDINTQIARLDEEERKNATNSGTPGDGSNPGGTDPPPPPEEINIIEILEGISISSYTGGPIEDVVTSANRLYQIRGHERVKSLLITLHLTSGQGASETFIDNVHKVAFPDNPQTTTVNGYTAYFGTDGHTYAVLSWAENRVVYELIMHSLTGSPFDVYDDILDAGSQAK